MDNITGAPAASLQHPDAPDALRLDAATATFRMLSDPTRLHILWLLAQEPSDVGFLVERTGASRTSVSQHLAKLRFSGLVTTRKDSRHIIYSIAGGHLARLVMEGLNHADHKVTGESVHD
ncbi:metalloregulator ArsR/SmtB family transcription factor [Arthrobacter sp. AL08]|uniref:ArsR/SmtB family transcription factor n=1 Tax=Micrococcaceae TaxID=1268 RepID=UPI001CFFDF5B|nr:MULTISPECIES: metalloregulator ArsR/SmtB family transcription factor [Micrococcaceae]MCB5281615.1 HTH-type transcriptional regulator KmtR [Arthrobacter sp. ES1]MDI3243455.1 metalloregulator ArsR/SmtB family transcription factor [Arthrobacter sp. AL05]MDI3279463.1 metalloregulator ArsR/SmtB family transcription factor [Arthrobacter sp. AL08]MDJ0353997.1 metalloregulator ArsR/SmtB family transcription factor [Pseudarthrobacter sp. PH31-O2]WGZ80905.1 metalloregulator ArsR/SmtB family transcrip